MPDSIKKVLSILMAAIITINLYTPAIAADSTAVNKARNDTAAVMLNTVKNPEVGSIGGEWAVIGLARSDYNVPGSYYDNYRKNVENYLRENKGVLDERKYTEYSRVILGLTAAGFDPRDMAGYDMTLPLGDFEKTIWQGINGPVFALIALDSANYEIPVNPEAATQATRDMYLSEILSRQLPDGGFALSKTHKEADADITGMVLQALSKYQYKADVKAAINKALTCLSNMQDNKGGYSSWGTENAESIIQVIVALCELGIDLDDSRFVKNGNSLLDRFMDYYLPGKGFEHTIGGGINQMATEQALYALAAIYRKENNMASLYDMSDVGINPANTATTEQPRQPSVVEPPAFSVKTFSDIPGHINREAIEALASREIIGGMGDGTFAPNDTMTRAQFAAIITQALGLTPVNKTPFSDMPAGAWYTGYVGAAYENSIISGKSASVFDPDGLIAKQEAASMTYRAARLLGMDTAMGPQATQDMLTQFPDYRTVSNYAKEALAFCYSQSIISQDELNIEPLRYITRGEIAEMLYRMLAAADKL